MVEEITVGAALRRLTHYLEENGIEAPDFEALQMLQSLGYSKIRIWKAVGSSLNSSRNSCGSWPPAAERESPCSTCWESGNFTA